MPTIHPRYTVTDTDAVREMLDLAARRWPEVSDRRQLLLLLAGTGAERVAAEFHANAEATRRQRQRQALARAHQLIDSETLLTDSAWR